jgi:hypothetical protein
MYVVHNKHGDIRAAFCEYTEALAYALMVFTGLSVEEAKTRIIPRDVRIGARVDVHPLPS